MEIFLSYAHKDKALLHQLEKHLTPLKRRDDVAMWHARDISAGAEWQQAIDEHLNKAHLIILLISPDFMSSENCYSNEMKRAVERHDAGEARVIPVLLRPVDWQKAPFGKLQALPRDAPPITLARNRDHAFVEVAQAIHTAIEELSVQSATYVPETEKKEEIPHPDKDACQPLALTTLPGMEQRGADEETSKLLRTKEALVGERKAALIVGVNNRQHPSPLPDLNYAEHDAHEVYHTLRQPACNFEFVSPVLVGDNAETRDVRRAVIKLAQEKADESLLLFYFIGHAQPMRTKEGYNDIYFVTYDFDENEVKEDPNSHLSLRWLRDRLYRPHGVGSVLIILDCCYVENNIQVGSDQSHIDVHMLIKECLEETGDTQQNNRLRTLLTSTVYNTPTQERVMTSLVLSVLQGKIAKVIDPNGNIHVHALSTYLQDQMPLAQFSPLSEDFSTSCVLAWYPQIPQSTRQTEEKEHFIQMSELLAQMSHVITDSKYFIELSKTNTRPRVQQFDQLTDETAFLADLNQDKIAEFLKIDRVQIQDDFYLGSTQQDQLQYFCFLEDSHPTYGALLCFGIHSTKWLAGAFTHCTLWRGNDRNNGWLNAQDYRRDLIAQFEGGRDFLRRSLRLARTISMDARVEELEVPLVALEEALANALVHREYENQTSPVYIDIFDDRIEISSPGLPPEPMTMELLEEEHNSHPRNPQIARIFYLYGYVEKVGSGVQRMQHALQKAGLRAATFKSGKDKTFRVIFYRPQQMTKEVINSTVASINSVSKTASPMTIFYAYAQQDEALRDQLEKHLRLLLHEGVIASWHDRKIMSSEEWAHEIDTHLETASIILLLVSPDFIASDYCYDNEMQRALERHKRGEAHVVPIILRACDWQYLALKDLQYLPRDGKPVTEWDNPDYAFLDIVKGIRRIIDQQALVPSSVLFSSQDRQNRLRMLRRVRQTWIDGLLTQSLHHGTSIKLCLQDRPDVVENPLRQQTQELDQPPLALPDGTSISQVYDIADGGLLILGEPGAGKTTLLLELTRSLLERAETDERFPMPIVFNLSSWAAKRQPLGIWLVEELRTTYQVPHKIAKAWVDAEQVLLLLDGLDEVAEEARGACVQQINNYYQSQLISPMVVCCRREEYTALSTRVRLSHAVSILPLTDEQINRYLDQAGEQVKGLRQALSEDAELHSLARQPLMLNIFAFAYQGARASEVPSGRTREEIQHMIFARYVERMLNRRRQSKHWKLEQVTRWLTFLAKQMQRHDQTVFYLERLQSDWLSGKQRVFYHQYVVLLVMLVFGFGIGLSYGLNEALGSRLVGGLAGGLVSGLIGALGSGLINRLDTPIEPTEVLTWSWKEALSRLPGRLASGLAFGLIGGLIFGLASTLLYGLISGLVFVLVFMLISGLSRQQLPEHLSLSPNEGIWRSGRNGLYIGLLMGLLMALLMGVIFGLLSGLSAGLSFGLLSGVFAGLNFGLFFGLKAFVQHFILRFWLWRAGSLPWNLVNFLDEASERLLLSKIGGSYMFIHRLLLEYFATLDESTYPENTPVEGRRRSGTNIQQ